MNDIVVNKIQSMQRCNSRAREEYEFAGGDLASNITHQDAAVLNITRACELAIDLANHLTKVRRLGIPTDSRESFELLAKAGFISPDLTQSLQSMVGFRNVAVHDYRELDAGIVKRVIEQGFNDLLTFADEVREALA
ncbi:MAG: DUF86 domain-containing protein [Gammaproteobacteria bacterium]|nr:DUF86 domain-containing protein [Gammaproteobacteria bacterium]